MRIVIVLTLLVASLPVNAFTTLVNQYDFLNIGSVRVNNNIWNSPSGTQRLLVNTDASWLVDMTSFNKPTNGAPGSYPNSQIGCHWGACTANNPLPRQVSGLVTASTIWYASGAMPTGNWNQSLDVWFNTTPTTSVAANAQELMIWARKSGAIQPIGSIVGTITIGKAVYQIWHGGIVTTYLRTSGVMPATYNLKLFMNDAIARGYINPAWYLITIQAGFEIWTGGVGLATTQFTNTIN